MQKEKEEEFKGLFADNLFRSNTKIKKDRAISIIKSSETIYRRHIEDLEYEIDEMRRKQEALLDLSPTDRNALEMIKDFDPRRFLDQDTQFIKEIWVKETHLKLFKQRYEKLFG